MSLKLDILRHEYPSHGSVEAVCRTEQMKAKVATTVIENEARIAGPEEIESPASELCRSLTPCDVRE